MDSQSIYSRSRCNAAALGRLPDTVRGWSEHGCSVPGGSSGGGDDVLAMMQVSTGAMAAVVEAKMRCFGGK